jgi:hypothetical protein
MFNLSGTETWTVSALSRSQLSGLQICAYFRPGTWHDRKKRNVVVPVKINNLGSVLKI